MSLQVESTRLCSKGCHAQPTELFPHILGSFHAKRALEKGIMSTLGCIQRLERDFLNYEMQEAASTKNNKIACDPVKNCRRMGGKQASSCVSGCDEAFAAVAANQPGDLSHKFCMATSSSKLSHHIMASDSPQNIFSDECAVADSAGWTSSVIVWLQSILTKIRTMIVCALIDHSVRVHLQFLNGSQLLNRHGFESAVSVLSHHHATAH
jgi:hypothetical protein